MVAPAQARQGCVVKLVGVCWPQWSASPVVGRSSRPMMLSSVLLPEPDGPVSATNSASRQRHVDAVQHLGFHRRIDVVALVDVVQVQECESNVPLALSLIQFIAT
jgi:hypothetical protein